MALVYAVFAKELAELPLTLIHLLQMLLAMVQEHRDAMFVVELESVQIAVVLEESNHLSLYHAVVER